MRSSLFWFVTQLVLVVVYRHFKTAYGSYLQESSTSFPPEDGTDRLSQNVGQWVTTPRSKGLVYTVSEA
jgi:hypothetical protein